MCSLDAQPHAHVRFRRAIERRALWLAEDAARELPNLPLEDALQPVHSTASEGLRRLSRRRGGGSCVTSRDGNVKVGELCS